MSHARRRPQFKPKDEHTAKNDLIKNLRRAPFKNPEDIKTEDICIFFAGDLYEIIERNMTLFQALIALPAFHDGNMDAWKNFHTKLKVELEGLRQLGSLDSLRSQALLAKLFLSVGETKETEPAFIQFLNDLCSEECHFDKYSREELFQFLKDNFEFFQSITLYPIKDTKAFVTLGNNLKKLLLFLIKITDLARLDEEERTKHFSNLRSAIFQYFNLFPELQNEFLITAEELITHDSAASIPHFVVEKSPYLVDMIKCRYHPWQQSLCEAKAALESKMQKFAAIPEKKEIELRLRGIQHQQSQREAVAHATLTDIWLHLVSKLQSRPKETETHILSILFLDFYAFLKYDRHSDAILTALAGIKLLTRSCSASDMTAINLWGSCLDMPDFETPSRVKLSTFSCQQYSTADRLPLEFKNFSHFLITHQTHLALFNTMVLLSGYSSAKFPSISSPQPVKQPSRYLLLAKNPLPISGLLDDLHRGPCELAKYDREELFEFVARNIDTLQSKHKDSPEFQRFNANLEKLFIFLIDADYEDQAEVEIVDHITKVRSSIFPFVPLFPGLGEHILLMIRRLANLEFQAINLIANELIKELLDLNPRISFPLVLSSQYDNFNPKLFEINNRISKHVEIRMAQWRKTEGEVVTLQIQFKKRAESLKPLLAKLPSKAATPVTLEHKTQQHTSRTSLTALWLELSAQLQTQPHDQAVLLSCVIFARIYSSLNRDLPTRAVETVIAGIPMLDKEEQRAIFCSFLHEPTGDAINLETFCRKQYEVMDQLQKDFTDFQTFLKENPEHRTVFNAAKFGIPFVIDRSYLRTTTFLATLPNTPAADTELSVARTTEMKRG